MCQQNDKLLLCTCLDNDEEPTKLPLKWVLERYLGERKSNRIGKIIRPFDSINGLAIDDIINQLNNGNCFDFEYTPVERDCLHINNLEEHPNYRYMKFIFLNGKWQEGGNPVFVSMQEEVNRGIVAKVAKTGVEE